MTETLVDVTARKTRPEPTAEQVAARGMVRQAREQGLSLTGPGGLLKQLTKNLIETALEEELTEHLGHEKHGPAGGESGNIRNGARPKTVLTDNTGRCRLSRNIRRLACILAGLASALVAFITVSPAAFAYRLPPSGGGGAPAPAQAQIHTIVTGGMPGWQITLIAAAAALVAATLAALANRALAARRAPASAA